MAMFPVANLEMDVAHVCNLHCEGCTHYSNYGLKGHVPLETGAVWLRAWSARLQPGEFSLLGGEPMLNPQLCDYIRLVAELWPQSVRTVVTNGLAMTRHPALMPTLAETGTRLLVSIHSADPTYQQRVQAQLMALAAYPGRDKVALLIRKSLDFYATYRGRGPEMRPYEDGAPRQSWEVCHNKGCYNIHRGQLWKCPPIAYLAMIAEKFGLDKIDAWAPYLRYVGIAPDASDEALGAFLAREEEGICRMCPSRLTWHKALPE